jgi:hypothetical protein
MADGNRPWDIVLAELNGDRFQSYGTLWDTTTDEGFCFILDKSYAVPSQCGGWAVLRVCREKLYS